MLFVVKGVCTFTVRKIRDINKDREKAHNLIGSIIVMALTRARISGVDIPLEKRIEIALTYINGVGFSTSVKVLEQAKIDANTRTKDLDQSDIKKLSAIIEKDYKVEGELRQTVFRDIKRLKDIQCYRGMRHKLGLPVRGQRTRTNAVTRKGRNIAVGGLKRKLEKT